MSWHFYKWIFLNRNFLKRLSFNCNTCMHFIIIILWSNSFSLYSFLKKTCYFVTLKSLNWKMLLYKFKYLISNPAILKKILSFHYTATLERYYLLYVYKQFFLSMPQILYFNEGVLYVWRIYNKRLWFFFQKNCATLKIIGWKWGRYENREPSKEE